MKSKCRAMVLTGPKQLEMQTFDLPKSEKMTVLSKSNW